MAIQSFFILGNHPALSVSEIFARLGLKESEVVALSDEFLIVERNITDIASFQNELGGSIKIGEVLAVEEEKIFPRDRVLSLLGEIQSSSQGNKTKFHFGLSIYGKRFNPSEIWKLAMDIKKALREAGSVRFIRPQSGQALNSVSVKKNDLLGAKGVELVLMYGEEKVFIGRTRSVQNFEMLSFRDYGRPARDDLSGMLPPKLAQMMLNIAGASKDGVLWDPFCGSGTILEEALLMGYEHVIGTDISEKAVADTKKNLEWLKRQFGFSGKYEVFGFDIRGGARFPENGVDAIVTEPYLGSPRARDIGKEIPQIEKLYENSLKAFAEILKPHGKVVMVWPAFMSQGKKYFLSEKIIPEALRKIEPLAHSLRLRFAKNLSPRGNLLYSREGQGVGREVVVLEKS